MDGVGGEKTYKDGWIIRRDGVEGEESLSGVGGKECAE